MELQQYLQEVDDIFETVKENLGYDNFSTSILKYVKPTMNRVYKTALQQVEEYYNEVGDVMMAELMIKIQDTITELFTIAKVNDELFKSDIYSMSPGSQTDSHLAYDFDFEEFEEFIKSNKVKIDEKHGLN